jgi:hypothetical protein
VGVATVSNDNGRDRNPADDLEHWLRTEVVDAVRQLDAGTTDPITADELRRHFAEKKAHHEGGAG